MGQSTFQILEKSIISNNINTFRSTLQTTNYLPADYQDYELLIKALRLGRKRITNLLLKKGCRVKKPTGVRSITPLHIAVTKVGWSSVVLKLIARGARVEVCDDNGDTPIHAAFLSNAAGSVIDFLLKLYMKKTLVNAVNKDGLGLLHIACTRQNLDVIRALVDTGGSNVFSQVNLQINSAYAGWSSLHFAVSNDRHKIVKSLCEYESEVGVVNGQGSTPLHLAVHRRDVKMIDTLMQYADWNVNYVDSCGITHFMAACAGSDPEIVRQFLRIATDTSSPETLINAISAKVNDIDECPFAGYTPMHFAAEFGRLGTVQLLIDRDVHFTLSSKNDSPLDLARKRNHETITTLLETHCGECKICKKFEPDAEKQIVFVDSNEADGKPQIFRFNSTDSESREPSLDECCMLDIFPLPADQEHDCELCKLQEIFSIDNSKNQFGKDECNNEVKTQKVDKRKRRGTCSRRVRSKFCEYVSNEHSVEIFIAVAVCIYIVVCIIFISKYKFTQEKYFTVSNQS